MLLKKLEKEVKKLNKLNKKPLVIAISGTSGSGKSTCAKILKNYLRKKGFKVELIEAGEIFRGIIKEKNELLQLLKSKKALDFDYEADKRTLFYFYGFKIKNNKLLPIKKDIIIAVGRLTIFLAGYFKIKSIKIFLKADKNEIAKRISKDKGREEYGKNVQEIIRMIDERDRADIKRYKKLYRIENFIDESLKFADFVFDTTYLPKKKFRKVLINLIEPLIKQFL